MTLFNPANEHTWPEEQRLLLFEVMVLAALADGRVQRDEEAAIERRLADFRFTPHCQRLATDFRDRPRSIDAELAAVEQYQSRIVLFRHAVGVAYAHERLTLRERVFVSRLATTLGIASADRRLILRAFARSPAELTLADLMALMSFAEPRGTSATADHDAQPQAASASVDRDVQPHAIDDARTQLDGVGAQWVELASTVVAHALVQPIAEIWKDAVPDGHDEHRDEWMTFLDRVSAERLAHAVSEGVDRAAALMRSYVDEATRSLTLPDDFHRFVEDTWHRAVHDDAEWHRAVAQLEERRSRLLTVVASLAPARKAAGGAAGALFGGIGVAGALAAAPAETAELETLADGFDRAVDHVFATAERWHLSVHGHVAEICRRAVGELRLALDGARDPAAAAELVRRIRDHIERWQVTDGS